MTFGLMEMIVAVLVIGLVLFVPLGAMIAILVLMSQSKNVAAMHR